MAIGPYSTPVAPAEWVDPMDLNMYAKGVMYKQQMAEKNLKDISTLHNNILSIPAYGKDKEKLLEIDQQLKQQVGSMNLGNLGDINTFSQVKGVMGQYTTNPDVLAIAKRGSIYSQMLQEKEESEKNNKIYVNRGMNTLSKYFSGDEYIRDVKFGNDGYDKPDAAKMMAEVKKIVTPDERQVMGKNGQYFLQKYYEPEKVKTAFRIVTENNPNWNKFHRDTLEDALEDKDLDQYATQNYQTLLDQQNDIINKANHLKSTSADPKKAAEYEKIIQMTQADIDNINEKLKNPYLGTAYKKELLQKTMDEDINNMAEALQFTQNGDVKMDESTKLNRQLSNDIYKMREKEIYDLYTYMDPEDRAKIGTNKENEIDFTGYRTIADESKAKAAGFSIPNQTPGKQIGNYTTSEYDNAVSNKVDGEEVLGSDNTSKSIIVYLIKSNPELFPQIPKNMIDNLTEDHLQIDEGSQELEVDDSMAPYGATPQVTRAQLIEAKNKQFARANAKAGKKSTDSSKMDEAASGDKGSESTGAEGLDAAAETE